MLTNVRLASAETFDMADGTPFTVGERVSYFGETLTIVANLDADEYSSTAPRELWRSLNAGVIAQQVGGSLRHFRHPFSCLHRLS